MRSILVRHGQSTANAAGAFTGGDDVVLTRKGQSEAEDTARRLHKAGLFPVRIFCSPLARCMIGIVEFLFSPRPSMLIRTSAAQILSDNQEPCQVTMT